MDSLFCSENYALKDENCLSLTLRSVLSLFFSNDEVTSSGNKYGLTSMSFYFLPNVQKALYEQGIWRTAVLLCRDILPLPLLGFPLFSAIRAVRLFCFFKFFFHFCFIIFENIGRPFFVLSLVAL